MSYLETIRDAFNDPDIRFLGQIDISDDEYKELISYARRAVNRVKIQSPMPADIFLSVALVQIAIKKYSDGNYWDFFKKELDMPVPASKANLIGQIFIATLRRHHLFQIEREVGAKYAYVENIKAHAFVPSNYLSGYYDFLFAFYDRNLLRQLPDDISEDFTEMAEFFASTLKDNTGDSFELRSMDNKPSKSYRLLKATRTLFAQGDSAVLAKIMYSHLKIIDNYYYDSQVPDGMDRFKLGFSEWIKNTSEIDARYKKERKRGDVFYKKPYFYIDRRSQTAYLIIPEQKIRDEDYEGSATVDIYHGQKHHSINMSLYRAFGVLVSDMIRLHVDNIFEEYRITISTKSNRVFSISSQNYRIFDGEFFEIPKLRNGKNYLLLKKDSELRGEKPVYVNDSYVHWNEYAYDDINEQSVIYIDNYPISTAGSFAVGVDFAYVSEEYQLYESEKQVQTAYKHPTVSFKISKEALDGCFILAGGKRFPVKSNSSVIIDLADEKGLCGVIMNLEELIPEDEGLFRVMLDEPRKQIRELCRYVLLRTLRCHPEKRRYTFAKEAVVTLTGDYDIQPINCIKTDESFNYILPLDEDVDSADFALHIMDDDFIIKVPISIFRHGFEGKLKSSKPEYLWYTDLKNDLYISMPGATEANVYLDSRSFPINVAGVSLGNGMFRFDISEISQVIRNSDLTENNISLRYRDNKIRTLSLYRVLRHLYVKRADVFFDDNNNVAVNIQYEGDNDLVLRFVEDGNNRIAAERTVTNGVQVFPELSGDNLYCMHMLEKSSDAFGFFSEETEISSPKKGIGAINLHDISNCKILQINAYWSGEKLQFGYYYGLYQLKKIDEYSYFAKLVEQKRTDSSGIKYKSNTIAEKVLVECIPDNGKMNIISLQTEYEEDIYDPVYYDKKQQRYICVDDISDNDYGRYIPMYDDEAVFEMLVRRIK